MTGYISPLPSASWRTRFPRTLVLLGSTGSIGSNALRVVDEQPEYFHVAALAGARNTALLAKQAHKYRPEHLAVLDGQAADELKTLLPTGYTPQIHTGQDGYEFLATLPEADCVLSAQVGAAGLRGTLAAARAGKTIALANKESLVLAGDLLRTLCHHTGASILPVDSEHNAIFQALQGRELATVRRIILTASGGPFRGRDKTFLQSVTNTQALCHPNWQMGAKISIDSATLMNKGLEIIEACHLYSMPLEKVEVVVHPQSVIHSLVEYGDGSQMAQMGPPDMRIAIAYCLGWPRVMHSGVPPLDLLAVEHLTFEPPELFLFPCLELAREAYAKGNGLPVVLNAANEVAVDLFLQGKITFLDIATLIKSAMQAHEVSPEYTTCANVECILALDSATRKTVPGFVPPQS